MKTKHIIVSAVTVLMAFSACQRSAEDNSTQPVDPSQQVPSARIYLTDHATPVFDSVFIDLQKLELRIPGSGWVELNIQPGIYNILQFRNGLDTLFGTGNLPATTIDKIRLTLGQQNSAMKNGQSFPLRLKNSNGVVEVGISGADIDISSSNQISATIDFDAGNSIKVDNSGSGNNNGYILDPRIRVFSGSNAGRIEGRVLPLNADAIVKAINGTDTATAIPDDSDAEFKIVGLAAGNYQLLFDGQNGYNDTMLSNIHVAVGEDTHLPLITLHR